MGNFYFVEILFLAKWFLTDHQNLQKCFIVTAILLTKESPKK